MTTDSAALSHSRPARLLDWVHASGPPLILVLVLQGAYAVSASHHLEQLSPWRVGLTLAMFVFDGIGRRLINDYEDHARGLDRPDRVRPDSSLALGLDMRVVRRVGMTGFVLAWLCAGYLAVTTTPWLLLSIPILYLAYFAYAGGRRPLGHRGLGEALDFVFTGTMVTLVVGWVNVGRVDGALVLAALGAGFLFMSLMLHNNARDVEKDAAVGKTTLPQLVPPSATKAVYVAGLSGFYLCVAGIAVLLSAPWYLLPLVTLPWTASLAVTVLRGPIGDKMVSWARLYLLMIANFALFSVGAWL
ncbi:MULTISPECIES: prenyltransferase [Actinoalloteichus]|uniref:1,4-dihydroxy-2-naphthoate prenyltransferase n=1 Tax=Actinoalloteichus fjordicus TaxID=1612552 RepID=A0AAC9LE20_9PSEU|nr:MULTISPECIES: UbiA family prenyltransferase [Actinoalloteichus]APU14605.1 1,4-dihydroxy-2-naphthoate prenyltransferase [Actinoalloteichus fjordicus]APU20573.1 1,4-dihydroxy-2-naphthoate prenyltransferase [Actinoalloteichus sp. GBA129-24]